MLVNDGHPDRGHGLLDRRRPAARRALFAERTARVAALVAIILLGVLLVLAFGRWLDRLPRGAQLVSTVVALDLGGDVLRPAGRLEPAGPGLGQAAALIGCGLFLLILKGLGFSEVAAAWMATMFVFALRMLAIRYDIQSRPLAGFSPDQGA